MSAWMLGLIGLLYAGAAVDAAAHGDWKGFGLFVCYGLSNAFIIAMRQPVHSG